MQISRLFDGVAVDDNLLDYRISRVVQFQHFGVICTHARVLSILSHVCTRLTFYDFRRHMYLLLK